MRNVECHKVVFLLSMEVKSVTKESYVLAALLSTSGDCALWVAAIIVVVGMFLGDKTSGSSAWGIVLIIQALMLAAYSFLTLGSSVVNFRARKLKINDTVDNAFGTEIGGSHSENYFDNQEITSGHKRLLFNTAESCFFSYRELKSMWFCVCLKLFVPLAVLIVGLILNKAEVIMAIFRITAILMLIVQVVRFFVALFFLKVLLNQILNTLKHKIGSAVQFSAESINYTLEYETLMVWYGTKIPDKVYRKMNEKLTSEWEKMKNIFVAR